MVLSLRVSLEALLDKLWQVQGGAGREPAAGVRIGEKAESTDTEVTGNFQRQSEGVCCNPLWELQDGEQGQKEGWAQWIGERFVFKQFKLCSPEIFLFSLVMVTLSYPVT